MEKFAKIIDRITGFFGGIAGIFILLGVALIVVEIIARAVFDSTIYITAEYTAYFMVAITLLGLAIALRDKSHIRVTLIHGVVKEGKPRFILDLVSFIIGFVVFIFVTYAFTMFFWDAVVTGSRSMQLTRTYLAIPRFTLVLGSLLMTFQFLAEIIKLISAYRKGELDERESESTMLGR
jgi:TRAP-type C4-dicarboxylate transport system permease small subunit